MKKQYGIFTLHKNVPIGFPENRHFAQSFVNVEHKTILSVAHDTTFKTEEEAIEFIKKLPKPAFYTIVPIYLSF